MVPGQDTGDIAVGHGPGFPGSNGSHSRRGIIARPLERQKGLIIPGKDPSQFINDPFCRGMHVPGTGIISQPLPHLQEFIFGSLRQRLHLRKPFHKAKIVGQTLPHLRLLQNHLRNPDQIRIPGFPPGKITPVHLIPLTEDV